MDDKYDRYRAGSLLGLLRAKRGCGDNDVDLIFDEFPSESPKPIWLLGRKSMLKMDNLAVDITEISEGFDQDA